MLQQKKKQKELFEEVSNLKNKLSELEEQLKEGKKLHTRLINEDDRKIELIRNINNSIIEEKEKYAWKKMSLLSRYEQFHRDNDDKIKDATTLKHDLTLDLAGYDVLKEENKKLQLRLKQVAYEYYKQRDEQDEEKETRKQMCFDINSKLDSILHKAIKSYEKEHANKALEDMNVESEVALKQNMQLLTEYDAREEKCETLVRQQQNSFDTYNKLHLEREVIEMTMETQEKTRQCVMLEINEQEKMIYELKKINSDKVNDLKYLNNTFDAREKLANDYKKSQSDLALLKERMVSTRHEAISLCRVILNECFEIMDKSRAYTSKIMLSTDTTLTDNSAATTTQYNYSTTTTGAANMSTYDKQVLFPVNSTVNSQTSSDAISVASDNVRQLLHSAGEEVWNSNSNDCPVISGSLRKFLKQQRRPI